MPHLGIHTTRKYFAGETLHAARRRFLAWSKPLRLSPLASLGVGVAFLGLATLLRFGLEYLIPGRLASITFFPAIVLAAYVAGARGGFVVLAGAIIVSWFTWIAPADARISPGSVIGGGVFVIAGTMAVLAVTALRDAVFELADQDERARLINQELNHRIRNLFSVVATLVSQTLRQAGVNSAVSSSLVDRITAIARGQELITLDDRKSISFRRLVDQVLGPIVPEPSRLVAKGGRVGISGHQVTGFALVLHELGTNALKYGAWSNASGRVTLNWQLNASGLSLTWRERGGPVTSVPRNSGLGSVLIEGAIGGATVQRRFEPAGLTIVVNAPPEFSVEIEPTVRPVPQDGQAETT